MNANKSRGSRSILAAAVLGILAMPVEAALNEDAEVIIEWNGLLYANMPATAGLFGPRHYATLHVAMFDAVNAIERAYEPYHVELWANPAASAEAAAAQAAHDVLYALIPAPAARAAFDAALAARLATIEPWRVALGVPVGQSVAQAVLEWRTGDGTEQPNLPYLPPALPGMWQPTPPAFAAAAFVQFANVEPFGLLTPTQYLPDRPPLLGSAQYAADLEQVKAIGSSTSATRTADQTLVARLHAGVGYTPTLPFPVWNNVARDVTRDRGLSLVDSARVFALLNVSIQDGIQTSHTSKFVYGLWRPITAIRRADEDLNPQTTADPGWAPLINTPPYPSHASNLTCVVASAARSLERVLGNDAIPFSVTWAGTGGNAPVTRSYAGFEQFAAEGGLSRVYAGIHFLFEITASHESCKKVADYVFENYAQPLH